MIVSHLFLCATAYIQHLTRSSKNMSDQVSLHHKSALIKIIRECFDATIQYSNTRRQYLINQGTLMSSALFQQYLYNIHDNLDINEWINNEKQIRAKSLDKKYPAIGPEIMNQLRHKLHLLSFKGTDKACKKQNMGDNNTDTSGIPIMCSIQSTNKISMIPSNTNSVVTSNDSVHTNSDNDSCTQSQASFNCNNNNVNHQQQPFAFPQNTNVSPPDLQCTKSIIPSSSTSTINHQIRSNHHSIVVNGYGPIHGSSAKVKGKSS